MGWVLAYIPEEQLAAVNRFAEQLDGGGGTEVGGSLPRLELPDNLTLRVDLDGLNGRIGGIAGLVTIISFVTIILDLSACVCLG